MVDRWDQVPAPGRRHFLKTGVSALATAPLWLGQVGDLSLALATGPAAQAPPEKYFEAAFGVTQADLKRVLTQALAKGGDYGDLFFEHSVSQSLVLEDDRVSRARLGVSLGVGVRVLKGERTGYAFSQSLDRQAMLEAARTAASLAAAGGRTSGARGVEVKVFRDRPGLNVYPMTTSWETVAGRTRIDILRRLGRRVKARDSRIERFVGVLADGVSRLMVVTSEGLSRADLRPDVGLAARCVARKGRQREAGTESVCGRAGLEFISSKLIADLADKAVAKTTRGFEAVPLAAGEMPCVLAPGSSGILLHEAIGHGLEADFNRRRISTFADRMGQRIASPEVTIIDDGTIPGSHGSIAFDDEGADSQRTVLVAKGRLVSYLHDRLSAAHYRVKPTGSGRRQGFEYAPLPRMRTTLMQAGPHDPGEIIASVKKGLYAEVFTNGQVKIGAGDFTFYVRGGYAIENGRQTHPIKDVNVIGNGPEVLSRITMVGRDLALSRSWWTCGKAGQGVAVSLGMPTALVSSINVGGARD
jgi:TldD protein